MQHNSKISQASSQGSKEATPPSNHTIAIYVALRILGLMKKTLGIEAMLEYIDCSLDYVAKTNPALQEATEQILKIIDIEKIYKEILYENKNIS